MEMVKRRVQDGLKEACGEFERKIKLTVDRKLVKSYPIVMARLNFEKQRKKMLNAKGNNKYFNPICFESVASMSEEARL